MGVCGGEGCVWYKGVCWSGDGGGVWGWQQGCEGEGLVVLFMYA